MSQTLYCHKYKTINDDNIKKIVQDPVTNIAYNTCDKLSPHFSILNITPNVLTSLSFAFALIGNIMLIKNKYILVIFFHSLGILFDACDGCHARNTNNITIFGDMYDHVTDYVTYTLYVLLLLGKYKKYRKIQIVIILLTLFGISIHACIFGCVEKHSHIDNKFIGKLSIFCNKKYINNYKKYALGTAYFDFLALFVFTLLLYFI